MNADGRQPAGAIIGLDLTVSNAEGIRDFYAAVVGWRPEPLDMGGYDDFFMMPSSGDDPVAGVCHARGENADLPPQWLVYITVDSLDESIRTCVELGGSVISGPKGEASSGRYCVIKDPAGAVMALLEQPMR